MPEALPADDDAFRALVRPLLVPTEYTRPNGRFDALCAEYRPLWDSLASFAGMPGAPDAIPDDEQSVAREECLRQAGITHPSYPMTSGPRWSPMSSLATAIDPAAATADDYRRMTGWLRRKAVPVGAR